MGRTLPTIIQALRAEEEGWRLFRRALRKEDQEAFDLLWRLARRHAAPSSMAGRPMPMEAAFMGMLVGLARRLMDVKGGPEAASHEGPEDSAPGGLDL